MKLSILKYITLVFFIWMNSSCEKPTAWELDYTNKHRMVIDGIITDELKPQQIKLSLAAHELNELPMGIPDANVSISIYNLSNHLTGYYTFYASDSLPGLYVSEPFAADHSHIYLLRVSLNKGFGEVLFSDSAYAHMDYVDSLAPIAFTHVDSLYQLIFTESSEPSMLHVEYNWSEGTAYCQYYGSCRALEYYYTLPVYPANRLFAPQKQTIKFPSGTNIIRRKYSLTNDHQQFLRHLLTETEWRGGLFDVEPANVPSNFRNGSLGFFAVCMVHADTTYVK